MSNHKSKRALRRHNSAAKYARRLAINIQVQPEAVADKPYQFKNHARTCSCCQCAHNRRRFCGNSLEGLSRQERRNSDSADEQQESAPRRLLEVVEFPYDRRVNRFGKTYSIREDGEFWLTSNGSRRAWSYYETAHQAMIDAATKQERHNPYALPSGETPGRLGKAWQRGYDGLPPSKSWTRGSASWKAYQQGKATREG